MSDKPSTVEVSCSELIRIHRDRLHISQSELAKSVGVSRNYISLIERGYAENASLKVLSKILKKLGLGIQVFYVGDKAVEHGVQSDGACACPYSAYPLKQFIYCPECGKPKSPRR